MNILYLGSFAENWSTGSYIANALDRAGHSVIRLEESTSTYSQVVEKAAAMRPDVLLSAKWRFREGDIQWPQAAKPIIKMFDAVRPYVGSIVTWLFDLMAPGFSRERFRWSDLVAGSSDLFVLTDGYTVRLLDRPNCIVIRQGVPDDVDQAAEWRPERYTGDVLFLGTPYGERRDLALMLNTAFRGERFRVENRCRGKELTKLVRSYRIVIGPGWPTYPGYWSNRIYVVTGNGGLFAGPTVEGMKEDGWQPGENYLEIPSDHRGAVDWVRQYLNDWPVEELERARAAGFKHANERCTYDRRVAELVAAIGKINQGGKA